MENVKTVVVRHCCSVWRVAGALLLGAGLVGDCLVGFQLLAGASGWDLLWHVPLAMVWAGGVNLLAGRGETWFNRWGWSALLLGSGTFPGLGELTCTLAFVLARALFARAVCADVDAVSQPDEPQRGGVPFVPRDEPVLPFVDDVCEGNTDARRAVVAELSRAANPETTQLLRRLLCDARAEIRCDASIALNYLEDKMSHELHQAFADWRANPADTACSLAFVDHCYRYATSNVLDAMSQRLYLVLVRDLLQQVLAGGEPAGAALWLQLADVRQRLGELPEALQDALHAMHLRPEASDASALAMDLAFRSHAWDVLSMLAAQHTDLLPGFSPGQRFNPQGVGEGAT